MNDKINMLKHLASVWCDENIPELYSEETNGYGKAWEDKFAELIVRECADAADMAYDARCATPGDYVVEQMGFGLVEGVTAFRS